MTGPRSLPRGTPVLAGEYPKKGYVPPWPGQDKVPPGQDWGTPPGTDYAWTGYVTGIAGGLSC